MKCPFCYSKDTIIVNTRWIESKPKTSRRYLCFSCSNNFTTYEKLSEKTVRRIRIYRLKIGGRN